jgi:hypothetical protein
MIERHMISKKRYKRYQETGKKSRRFSSMKKKKKKEITKEYIKKCYRSKALPKTSLSSQPQKPNSGFYVLLLAGPVPVP